MLCFLDSMQSAAAVRRIEPAAARGAADLERTRHDGALQSCGSAGQRNSARINARKAPPTGTTILTAKRTSELKIDLVCFDLGGVLVRVADGWPTACAAAGVPLPAALNDPQRRPTFHALYQRAEVGEIDIKTFTSMLAAEIGMTPQQMWDISEAWLIAAQPGAADLLRELTQQPVPTACLSNTNDHHWHMLTGNGGFDGLDLGLLGRRFASHEVGLAKPDPAIYEHVERQTNTQPDRILFFDDLPENCEAARRRGWNVHMVTSKTDPVSELRSVLSDHGMAIAPHGTRSFAS